MVADSLAVELAAGYVEEGDRVLDPFCGTGRTLLAAAERGAHAVGIDVNPLALLICRAKVAIPKLEALQRLLAWSPLSADPIELTSDSGRKVRWFTKGVLRELSQIVSAINRLELNPDELDVAGAVLSATVRETCYCRKDQWKLHRLAPEVRRGFRPSAWRVFRRRLRSVLDELRRAGPLPGTATTLLGDARAMDDVLKSGGQGQLFDCVITSPPYGDSRTTVQYGGMSSLSLSILHHVAALRLPLLTTAAIDNACLGGHLGTEMQQVDISKYWPGSSKSSGHSRVASYLMDLRAAFEKVADRVRPEGYAILILARRRVGVARVRVDTLAIDTLKSFGWTHVSTKRRKIASKLTPSAVRRQVQSKRTNGRVSTMREEVVLIFQNTKNETRTARTSKRRGDT